MGVFPNSCVAFVDVDVADGVNRDAAGECIAPFVYGGSGFEFRQQISIDVEAVGDRRIAGCEARRVDVEVPLRGRAGVIDPDLGVRDRVAVVVGEAEVEPADLVRPGGGEHMRLEGFSAAPVPVVAGHAAGPVLDEVEVSRGLIHGQGFRRRQGPTADVGVKAVDQRRLAGPRRCHQPRQQDQQKGDGQRRAALSGLPVMTGGMVPSLGALHEVLSLSCCLARSPKPPRPRFPVCGTPINLPAIRNTPIPQKERTLSQGVRNLNRCGPVCQETVSFR